jgi:hypothetical protein
MKWHGQLNISSTGNNNGRTGDVPSWITQHTLQVCDVMLPNRPDYGGDLQKMQKHSLQLKYQICMLQIGSTMPLECT